MKRLKICFIIEALIVLALIIFVPFTLNNAFESNSFILYLASKFTFGLLFIAGVCYALFSKAKTGSSVTIVGLASLFQLVPFGIRFIAKADFDLKWFVGILIIVFAVVIFVALMFGLSAQDKLAVKREEIAAGKTIEVEEEKRLATDEEKK